MNPALHREKRSEPRHPADGEVRVWFGEPRAREIQGRLMDVSASGFRMAHDYEALVMELDSRGYQYRVVNRGVSGNTTKDGVNRLKDVLAANPEIAVVEFGGNDGLRGLPITATRANLDQIISTLKNAGVKVVLAGITLPPDYGQDYIRDINETFTLAARKFKVPLLPFLLIHVYNIPGGLQQDGIHATAKGNAIVAEDVFALLKPLLKK